MGLSAGAIGDTLYGIGASWTSNGPDNPPGSTATGDERNADGAVWLEIIAADSAVMAPTPISSSETPASTAETATNFARGGAMISASSGTGGIDRPYDSGEQVVNLGGYLTANSIMLDDTHILAYFAGGMAANDILDAIDTGATIDPAFIATLVSETEADIGDAVSLGFTTVAVLNMPDLKVLPGVIANSTAQERSDLDTAVTGYNSGLAASIASLQSTYPGVEFITVDMYTLIGAVVSDPASYGFTDATTVLYADGSDPATATGADPATTAWFDPLHPSSALHAHIASTALAAGNAGTGSSSSTVSSTDSSGGGGSFDLLMVFALLIFLAVVGIDKKRRNEEA